MKFTPAGKVSLRAWRAGTTVRIDVKDTGIGIPAGAVPRVFDRFWQADATHTRGHGGLGLGLALVRYFVELHGGHMTAHSEGPGQGAASRSSCRPCGSLLELPPEGGRTARTKR